MSARLDRQSTGPRNRRDSRILWLAASVSCLGVVPCAVGQADQGQAREARNIEEIVVTAQKRLERLQDVPISISVMSGQELDQSTAKGITEELGRVAGVSATPGVQSGGTQLAVRGVTAGGLLFTGSSPVAYYLDSAPFGLMKSAVMPDPNAYDLERVEVLRGPQGTLYGASALNGVVRILTHEADVDEFEFKARTTASSTEDGGENYRGDMAVNVPIVAGKLAARAVVGYSDASGWIDRPLREDANDAEVRNGRLKIHAQPGERLSLGLSAWFAEEQYGAPSNGNDAAFNPSVLDESIVTEYEVYSAKLAYELTPFSITSMTSYLDYANAGALDYQTAVFRIPGTRLETELRSHVFSQEVLLSSNHEGPWRWALGGMYREGSDRLYQFRQQYVQPTDLRDSSESVALFGELTRLFLDGRFEVTGGLRYFEDDVTQMEFSRLNGAPPSDLIRNNRRTFDNVSPRAVLTWHPSDALTTYVSYAEGFRSGFNQNGNVIALAPEFPPLDADTLRNYEVGFKGNLGGAFSYELAAYYVDWEDVQQTLTANVGTATTPVPVTALVNGESASGPGVDLSLNVSPAEGLVFGVSVSWNDLQMDSAVLQNGVALFREGDRLSMSPEYTAGAMLEYGFPIGAEGWHARFSASGNYTSEQQVRFVLGPTTHIRTGDSMLVARTSFSIDTPDRWTATLFVDNVNNEQGSITGFPAILATNWYDVRVRPRTYGAQLEYRF